MIDTYLLRGFPFLLIFFFLFLVFHELLFPFLILLPVREINTFNYLLHLKRNLKMPKTQHFWLDFSLKSDVYFMRSSSSLLQHSQITKGWPQSDSLTTVRGSLSSLCIIHRGRQTQFPPTRWEAAKQVISNIFGKVNFFCNAVDSNSSMIHRAHVSMWISLGGVRRVS